MRIFQLLHSPLIDPWKGGTFLGVSCWFRSFDVQLKWRRILIEIQELVWTCSQKKLNASKTRNKIPPRPTGMMLMMICHGRIYIVYLSGHVTLISAKNVVTFLQKMSWPNQCFCFSIFIHSVNSALVSQDGTTCMHNWGGLCKYWFAEDVSSGHRLWTLLFRGKRPTDIR